MKNQFNLPRVKISKLDPSELLRIRMEEGEKAFTRQLYLTLIVLNDKFDFGKDELKRYLVEMLSLYQSIDKEFCSIEDVVDTVKKEIGIDLKTV